MKKVLLCLFLLSMLMFSTTAQVTRLSNNTSYEWGFPLTNTKLLLRSQISKTIWVYDIPGNSFTQLSSSAIVESDYQYAIMNGQLYFAGKTVAEGIELWVTDGTPGGTMLLKDINTAGDSHPKYGFVEYNSELYFTANDGTTGRELWKTNGTGPGTIQVKNINAGAADAFVTTPGAGDKISDFKVINGVLVFSAITAADGDELWATNGTDPGTSQIKNINITPGTGSHISDFTEYAGNLIFTAFDAANGDAVWITNGTDPGTSLVKDINTNPPAFPPPFLYLFPDITAVFFNFQNELFFTATDGGTTNGAELWKTNGTTAGTILVKDINPGIDDGFPMGIPAMLFAVKSSSKFFFSATTANEGAELWQSDGTGSGTTLLKDIEAGPTGSDVLILPNFFNIGLFQGNKFFCVANTPGVEGNEYYVSDGTPAGTTILSDINPGPASGFDINNLSWFYTSNKFFFVADDGINGAELWQSTGTGAGTSFVFDVNPAPGIGSGITFCSVASNTLFFFGTDGDDAVNTDFFKLDETLSLPLRWVSVEARPSNNDVLLLWETATEEQTDYFIVQRSSDGTHYFDLGRVNANGTGSNNYMFTDAGAMKQAGVKKWFYRIKYVDQDGKSALSRVATVALNKSIASILIAPNPVVNELKLVIQSTSNDEAIVSVMNMEGKTVLQKSVSIRRGKNTVMADASGLANGVYLLQITTGGSSTAERFMIQR